MIFPSKRIEKAVEGLKTCSTVMVHTNADVENLRKLGLTDNVVMIPHGIYPLLQIQQKLYQLKVE